MLLLLVQIAFRTTTRTRDSARSNYFLAVSCGSESKWIPRGMRMLCREKREAAIVVKEKKKGGKKGKKTEMTPLIADGLTSIRL